MTTAPGGSVFFLGTHKAVWLGRAGVPLFISRRTLAPRRTFPRAIAPWALDSGGFTEISQHGRWTITPEQYVQEVRRYRDEVGSLQWAASMDLMCEPPMLVKTGLTIAQHQQATTENYERLLDLAPDLHGLIAPVLQGWQLDDYRRHLELYENRGAAHGYSIRKAPVVGVGSVCRRQHTAEVEGLIKDLAATGLRLHGFGFKVRGLRKVHHALASSDSMAWSFNARKNPPLPACTHPRCSNCMAYALRWRQRLLDGLPAILKEAA